MEYPDVQGLAKTLVMKVCQLCAVDFTVEKFLLPLIDGMEATGWQVTTICSDGPAIPVLYRLQDPSHLRSSITLLSTLAVFSDSAPTAP